MVYLKPILNAARHALNSNPHPAQVIRLWVAQMPYLSSEPGMALLKRIFKFDPRHWSSSIHDEHLEQWPAPIQRNALCRVRALKGFERLNTLCQIPQRLTQEEQREVLDALLSGQLPTCYFPDDGPAYSISWKVNPFVQSLPEEWQEEWVVASANGSASNDLFSEVTARHDIDWFPDYAIRSIWDRMNHDAHYMYPYLMPYLAPDLRAQALQRARACSDEEERLKWLCGFDEELTDAERHQIVTFALADAEEQGERRMASHLEDLCAHLPYVRSEVLQAWLDVVLTFPEPYFRCIGLQCLLPALQGEDRDQAIAALKECVYEQGMFSRFGEPWCIFSVDELEALLERLLCTEPSNYTQCDNIISHILKERPIDEVNALLGTVVRWFPRMDDWVLLDTMTALTPGFAARTEGRLPAILAKIPVTIDLHHE